MSDERYIPERLGVWPEDLEAALQREVERRLTANGEHYCVSEGMNCIADDYQCIDAKIFGPCGHENCGGACTYVAECKCGCHDNQGGIPLSRNDFDVDGMR